MSAFTLRRWLVLAAGCALLPALGGSDDTRFAGHFSIGGQRLFLLTDAANAASSRWLRLGDTWAGRTAVAFDSATETLTVRIGNLDRLLRLQSAPVLANSSALPEFLLKLGAAEDYIVHPAGTYLALPNGLTASSLNGPLISNRARTLVAGTFRIEGNGFVMEVDEAVAQLDEKSMKWRPLFSGARNPPVRIRQTDSKP